MSKYELSLAADYVPDWTYLEAVREIFQNALDAGNHGWSYNEVDQILTISNKGAMLEPSSLLLGTSTKRGNNQTIGQFGEGYKIALLVLTREGKKVRIYNGKSGEVWTSRFVQSRRYGAPVLTIFIDRLAFWEVPNDAVVFEIEGITAEEFEQIKMHNLHVSDIVGGMYATDHGQILLDSEYAGKVFVNGLYVCQDSELQYGYNMKPEYLKLDRDRTTMRDFNIKWETSAMWAQIGGTECIQLCFDGAPDVTYVYAQYLENGVRGAVLEAFIAKYGTDAIPCRTQREIDDMTLKYAACKPIVVSNAVYQIVHDDIMNDIATMYEVSLKSQFEDWYSKYVTEMSDEGKAEWDSLLSELN